MGIAARLLSWKNAALSRPDLLKHGEHLLLKIIQEDLFSKELHDIRNGKELSPSSKIFRFSPFIDQQGLMRVGGRLQMTEWDFQQKHPILLGVHYLTEALIRHHHEKRFHEGIQSLLAFLRNSFWIISGRRLVSIASNAMTLHTIFCCHFGAKILQARFLQVDLFDWEHSSFFRCSSETFFFSKCTSS